MNLPYLLASAAVMAVVTYFIRMASLVIWRKKFKNKYIKSFLIYVPYGVLAALIFPGVLTSTDSMLSAVAGGVTALVLSFFGQKLLVVSAASVAVVFIAELLIKQV